METTNAPIHLAFNNGEHIEVERDFWNKNDLDRFDVVRATKHGKLILFYGEMLSDEDKATLIPSQEVKTDFNVILKSYGTQKLQVVKAVKDALGLGLRESMALVTELPAELKTGISQEEANMLKDRLEAVGAEVELK